MTTYLRIRANHQWPALGWVRAGLNPLRNRSLVAQSLVGRTRRRAVKPSEANKVSVMPVSIRLDTWRGVIDRKKIHAITLLNLVNQVLLISLSPSLSFLFFSLFPFLSNHHRFYRNALEERIMNHFVHIYVYIISQIRSNFFMHMLTARFPQTIRDIASVSRYPSPIVTIP